MENHHETALPSFYLAVALLAAIIAAPIGALSYYLF